MTGLTAEETQWLRQNLQNMVWNEVWDLPVNFADARIRYLDVLVGASLEDLPKDDRERVVMYFGNYKWRPATVKDVPTDPQNSWQVGRYIVGIGLTALLSNAGPDIVMFRVLSEYWKLHFGDDRVE